MKHTPLIASILLGGLFIFSASVVLFGNPEMPAPPKGSPVEAFFAAFGPTGYMTFVKVLELIGGVLLLIPKTRNIGLLFIGPIIVNILAFHQFVAKDGILQPMLIGISLLSLFLLWAERKAWCALVK
jgi:putative oxidoreductase